MDSPQPLTDNASMDGMLIAVAVLVLACVAAMAMYGYRDLTRDSPYDASAAHGRCEARLGVKMGMMVTCGRKTNRFSGQHWFCRYHPPENAKGA